MILVFSYFLGILWYIVIINEQAQNDNSFVKEYFSDEKVTNLKATTIVTYFMMTTLSTIGLGDFHPQNSLERMIIVLVMLLGTLFFSYIMNALVNELVRYKFVVKDNEHSI